VRRRSRPYCGRGLINAGAQADTTVTKTADVPFFVFVPCANGGAGEVVGGTITLRDVTVFNINGNNINFKEKDGPQGSDLVGLTTGDSYQATGITQNSFNGSLQNGQATTTFINNFRIIGQGPGNNFLVHETFHVTINANGDVTNTVDNFTADCR
jgi:hypothetical protein